MTDKDFLRDLEESFYSDEIISAEVSDDVMYRVKAGLDKDIRRGGNRRVLNYFLWAAACAAVLFIPVAVFTTLRYHDMETAIMSEEMTVKTSGGEKVTVTLPDGTEVCLNSDSELKYHPGQFCKSERLVSFSGEGYFSVVRDENRPFIISSDGLSVRVLGTRFNLMSRKDRPYSELLLEEGSVCFTSLLHGDSIVLRHHQKAVMDRATGTLHLYNMSEGQKVAPWRRNEIIFRNVKLYTVLSDLEDSYNITIVCAGDVDTSVEFTGTLFTDDLNGVLSTIEKTCDVRATLRNGEIMIKSGR